MYKWDEAVSSLSLTLGGSITAVVLQFGLGCLYKGVASPCTVIYLPPLRPNHPGSLPSVPLVPRYPTLIRDSRHGRTYLLIEGGYPVHQTGAWASGVGNQVGKEQERVEFGKRRMN